MIRHTPRQSAVFSQVEYAARAHPRAWDGETAQIAATYLVRSETFTRFTRLAHFLPEATPDPPAPSSAPILRSQLPAAIPELASLCSRRRRATPAPRAARTHDR